MHWRGFEQHKETTQNQSAVAAPRSCAVLHVVYMEVHALVEVQTVLGNAKINSLCLTAQSAGTYQLQSMS
jgi:hypothetical protein